MEEMEIVDTFKTEILASMQAFKRIWNYFPTSVISNCWRHVLLGATGGAETVQIERLESVDRNDYSTLSIKWS